MCILSPCVLEGEIKTMTDMHLEGLAKRGDMQEYHLKINISIKNVIRLY